MKVLVVDDERNIRETVVSLMSQNISGKYDLMQAEDGEMALEICRGMKIDILITDVNMPNIDGIELAEAVRKIYPQCNIIFISAHDDKAYLMSAIALQAVGYIEKPIGKLNLIEVIEKAINKYDIAQAESYENKNITPESSELFDILLSVNPNCEKVRKSFDAAIGSFELSRAKFLVTACKLCDIMVPSDIKKLFHKALVDFLPDMKYIFKETRDNVFVIVFISNKCFCEDEIRSLFQNVITGMKSYCSMLISIGRSLNSYCDVNKAYIDSIIELEIGFYGNYGIVDKTPGAQPESAQINIANLIGEFSEILLTGNRKDAGLFIDGIYNELKCSRNVPVQTTKALFHQFLYHIILQAQEQSILLNLSIEEVDNKSFGVFRDIYTCINTVIDEYYNNSVTNDQIVIDIKNYIARNYESPQISLKLISDYLHLSPAYICTRFKKVTGITINDYLTKQRIDKAKKLSLHTNFSVEQIANMVGYGDPNYFSRVFKKSTGCTLIEFKKKRGSND